jgi:hypothetical protein
MRDIYICDTEGKLLKQEGYCELPESIWLATFKYITEQYKSQILAQLWQYYYGQKGDAFLSPIEVDFLLKDIQNLQPLLKDIEGSEIKAAETNIQTIQIFFADFLNLCQKAQSRDRALRFVAD